MSVHAELPFERFRYWQGQLVRSRDLVDQLAEAERLTRWHNRSVHSAFGVRFGFGVTMLNTSGELRVQVECGVAYECSGAMLALQRSREIRVPPLDPGESIALLVRSRGSRGDCAGVARSESHHSLLEDDLQFDWKYVTQNVNTVARSSYMGDPGEGVPLARVTRELRVGTTSIDPAFRTLARPLARPRLATGSTIAGVTPWSPWIGGIQTRIDTSAAGFTRIPSYFAVPVFTRVPGPSPSLSLVFPSAHIENPGLTEFLFRVFVPLELRSSGIAVSELARDLGLVVCWLGCQPPEFLPPLCPGQRTVPPACVESDAG
jgi:hypothetical protein